VLASALALLGLAAPGPSGVATPLSAAGGPHTVGIRLIEPATVVWYPARPAAQAPATYRHYVLLALRDAGPGQDGKAPTIAGYTAFLRSKEIPAAGIEAWLDARMAAVVDAPPVPGRFPVVVVAPGFSGAVHDEAVIGEFLASHGYIAAVESAPGWRGRRMRSDADVLPVAREQALQLSALLDRARALPGADASRCAVGSYCSGTC
jgi:predicted dienelactone hydrolase